MKKYDTVIFDLGGVLVDWSPMYVFGEYFESEEQREYFFKHVCTQEWNEEQDEGKLISENTEARVKLFPEWEKPIRDYYGRWTEMLKGPIHDTVDILKRLKQDPELNIYALTNWSAETFPVALERFEFLHWFHGRVVSGEEKLRKPFHEFYHRLLERYNVVPEKAVFIDDNLRNVQAAEEIGIHGIHFQSPEQLEYELTQLGLL